MKKSIIAFFALSLAALPSMKVMAQSSSAPTPFEGSFTFSVVSPQFGDDEKHEMVMNLKGEKSEMDIDAGPQGRIKLYTDKVAKKQYVVMESMNMGIKKNIDDDKDTTKVELTPTGKSLSVAGHSASEYLLKTPKADISLWAASDFPETVRNAYKSALANSSNGSAMQDAAYRELAEKGLVPVKVQVSIGGQQMVSMEFVKFEQKKIDDAVFVVPTNIQFRDAGQGMGMQ